MWSTEHSIETTATSAQIWERWANVAGWPEWNADIAKIRLQGSFVEGSLIEMTPLGEDDPVTLVIAEAVEPELFADQAELPNTVVRTIHRAEPLASGGTRVTYRMEVTGTDAAQIGTAISGDFPQTLAALARHAER